MMATKPGKITKKWIESLSEDELAAWLTQASDAYYNTGKTIFTDKQFDDMKDRLESLNPRHPFIKQVGAPIRTGIDEHVKVQLPFWMGSMDKIKTDADVLNKWKKKHSGSVLVTDKLDGLSIMLYPVNGGAEWKLATRGNGKVGHDVTHLYGAIRGLPKNPSAVLNGSGVLAVRGEVLLPKKDWEKLKSSGVVEEAVVVATEDDEDDDAAPDDDGGKQRAITAGTLNAKTPNMSIAKKLDFVGFEWITLEPLPPSDQWAQLQAHGFKTAESLVVSETGLTVETLKAKLLQRRDESPYFVDGLVVYNDAAHKRITSGNPKYAFAFKSVEDMKQAEVTVTEVEWNISKHRYLKPTVKFNTVVLNGVNISKATGFNAKFIQDNNVGPGAKVIIVRSGGVIPDIVAVSQRAKKPALPEGTPYVWTETGVDIIVDESQLGEDGQAVRDIAIKDLTSFFATIEVKGVSDKTIAKLYEHGLDTIPRILFATKEQLLQVEGIKDKSATTIVAAMAEALERATLLTLMKASNKLGRGFGEKKLKLVMDSLPAIATQRRVPSKAELVAIKGIEEKTAEAFIDNIALFWDWVHHNKLDDVVCRLASGFGKASNAPGSSSKATDQHDARVAGKSFVFTGFRDADLKAWVEARGGVVEDSVKKTTHMVVAKTLQEEGGKITKAKGYGVAVVEREAFMKELGL